jgi:hypothetical protein
MTFNTFRCALLRGARAPIKTFLSFGKVKASITRILKFRKERKHMGFICLWKLDRTVGKAGIRGNTFLGVPSHQSEILMGRSESRFSSITLLCVTFTHRLQQRIFLVVVLNEKSLPEWRDQNQFVSRKIHVQFMGPIREHLSRKWIHCGHSFPLLCVRFKICLPPRLMRFHALVIWRFRS